MPVGEDSQPLEPNQPAPPEPLVSTEAPAEAEAPAESPADAAGFAAATMAELRRVVWPSRQQLFSESVAVILMVGASAAAIAALDRFYSWSATQVFR